MEGTFAESQMPYFQRESLRMASSYLIGWLIEKGYGLPNSFHIRCSDVEKLIAMENSEERDMAHVFLILAGEE